MAEPHGGVYEPVHPTPHSSTSLASPNDFDTLDAHDALDTHSPTFTNGANTPEPVGRRFFGATPGDLTVRGSLMSGQSSYNDGFEGAGASSIRSLEPVVPYHDEPSPPGTPSGKPERDVLAEEEEKRDRIMAGYASGGRSPTASRKRKILIGGILAGLALLFLIIFLPIYFTVVKKHPAHLSSGSGSGSGSGGESGSSSGSGGGATGSGGNSNNSTTINYAPTTGRDGSVVTSETGQNFTYKNSFGGFWVDDPDRPFSNDAQAQSWVPPLNQSWDWSKNRIFGVNLGGWLVTEPFITPALYEKYNVIDEWTLSQAMAEDTANGGLATIMENHYNTFITEQDFAQIAAAGLSWVRIPIGAWAIETRGDEPFLEGVSWKYFLKAVKWARKYGIRIKLDLHTMPGSQNGYNHSGKLGKINFLNGVMGIANAQRGLENIRILTEFISQPAYRDVIPIFGVMNEAVITTIGKDILSHFYLAAYKTIRGITGYGAGNGPIMSIHDGFQGPGTWGDYMRGADRLALDSHPYLCFVAPDARPLSQQATKPCLSWGSSFNASQLNFGITLAGEWSLSFNDCGKWLNGVGRGTRYEGTYPGFTTVVGDCQDWTNWPAYSQATKNQLKSFATHSMDALPNWFFWTWKIGQSNITNKVEAPQWSYSLGLANGWIPTDPRTSAGSCAAAGVDEPFAGPLKPTETGAVPTPTIDPAFQAEFSDFPPLSLHTIADVQYLPTYTATGTLPTLSPATYTQRNGTKVDSGNGWTNPKDTAQAPVEIKGCTYPPAWGSADLPEPDAPVCPTTVRRAQVAARTPPPSSS